MLVTLQGLPAFVCNKIAQVVVLFGRADYPHAYPNFFADAFSLMNVRLEFWSVAFLFHFYFLGCFVPSLFDHILIMTLNFDKNY
jgi:hypothetical protein